MMRIFVYQTTLQRNPRVVCSCTIYALHVQQQLQEEPPAQPVLFQLTLSPGLFELVKLKHHSLMGMY